MADFFAGTYCSETVIRLRLRLPRISLFILVLPCPLLMSLTDMLQNIEASKSGIEELLKRVMELEKKLRERRRQSLIEVLNALSGLLAALLTRVGKS